MSPEGVHPEADAQLPSSLTEELSSLVEVSRDNLDEDSAKYLLELDKLLEAFKSLILDIKQRIEDGEIPTIVVDDTGGRIPGLIIRKIISIHSKLHDTPAPNIVFVQSQKAKSISEVDTSGDEQLLKDLSEPVLIVTEFVGNGDTLSVLLERLARQGVRQVAVAAVGVNYNAESGAPLANYRSTRVDDRLGEVPLFVGSSSSRDGNNSLGTFDFNEAKGVRQGRSYDHEEKKASVRLVKYDSGRSTKAARKAAEVFAQELFDEVFVNEGSPA